MAKIDMKAVKAVLKGDKPSATIGNNRTLTNSGGSIVGALHGHAVFIYKPAHKVAVFDACGHSTMVTRQAMEDFAEAVLGTPCKVSFAAGRMTVKLGRDTASTDGSFLTLDL